MSVELLRPRVSELVFQLYARPLHPEFFDILAQRRIARDGYELIVRITRTGHIISWDSPDVHLTEVASTDPMLSERRRLLNFRLRGEQVRSLECAHGIRYQTSAQVETLTPEIFLHVHDEILSDGTKRGMLHNFQPHHRLKVAPLGFIAIEGSPGCLLFSSFHTFPDELTVVKTQSLIEKRPCT